METKNKFAGRKLREREVKRREEEEDRVSLVFNSFYLYQVATTLIIIWINYSKV